MVIVDEFEYDFGWAFRFDTKKYVESGNALDSLLDNDPLFVDRRDGHVYRSWGFGIDRGISLNIVLYIEAVDVRV